MTLLPLKRSGGGSRGTLCGNTISPRDPAYALLLESRIRDGRPMRFSAHIGTRAFLAAILAVAVLFAALLFPLACSAMPAAPGANCPDCSNAVPSHSANTPAMPDMPQHSGQPVCDHTSSPSIQAVTAPDTHPVVATPVAMLPALSTPLSATPSAVGTVVEQWHSPPPAILNTSANLRI
jgi:hypothetical protein